MTKKSSKVFLSYARADSEPAQKIAAHLRQAGFDVWDPERDVLPGDDLPAETQSALASSDAMVVFISPEAVASRSVSYEIQYALASKKFSGRLIPVTLRPTKGAPWILSRLANLAYESPKKTGAQIVDLLSSVAQDAS